MNTRNLQNRALLQHIKALSFDLDDTLWDCEPVIVHAEARLIDWMRSHVPDILDLHDADSLREHRMSVVKKRPELIVDVTLMRKAALQELFVSHGYPDELVEPAFDVFYRARSEVELYDGTHSLLGDLRERYRLIAITNGNADLDIIGLAHHFDDIQRASIHNAPKPHTQMFERSLQKLALSPAELLHIGDNAYSDVLGGQNAGALTVWFNQQQQTWPEDVPPATFEVASLAELKQLLSGTT